MTKETPLNLINTLLITLFVYTAVSKLSDMATFRGQMLNQPLPKSITAVLVWVVPASELLAATLLLIRPLRLFGLYLSLLLMTTFTAYVALVLANTFAYVPCSCGGILRSLSWQAHLALNIFFTLLSLTGIFLHKRTNDHWSFNDTLAKSG
jgi:hypothetical protein